MTSDNVFFGVWKFKSINKIVFAYNVIGGNQISFAVNTTY